MSTKSTLLHLRLDPEEKAWLESQVEELGLDNVSAVMRSLIRRARKGIALGDFPPQRAVGMTDDEEQARRERFEELRASKEAARKEAERKAKAAALRAQLEALERGEDPDLVHGREPDHIGDADEMIPDSDFEVPPDSDGGNVTEFKPLPTGFKPPGSLARPAGAANGLVGDRSPAGESMKRNYHHLLPR